MSKTKRNKEELPWVDIILTAQEMAILNDETAELSKLYIALSQRRDFSTGIVGLRTRISDKCLKEVMTLTKRQGRSAKKVSTRHLQRWLDQLKSCGLIIDNGKYVFELPLAPKYESEKKKCHQIVNQSVTRCVTKQEDEKTPINIGYLSPAEDEVSPDVSPEVSPDLGTPPKISEDLPNKDVVLRERPGFVEILNYLGTLGFRFHLLQNEKTILMIHGWLDAKVTFEDVKLGVEAANAKLGKLPGHPIYYLNGVVSVNGARTAIKSEIDNERLREPRRFRKSQRDLDDEAQRKIDECLNRTD